MRFFGVLALLCAISTASYAAGNTNQAVRAEAERKPPLWTIFRDGRAKSVPWKLHVPNPRFATYDNNTRFDQSDDLVWDGETGLLWERMPTGDLKTFDQARIYCFSRVLGGRLGARLPTLEELASLVDPTQSNPALPAAHPFNLDNLASTASHQSSTTAVEGGFPPEIFYVKLQTNGEIGIQTKASVRHAWCVRGGVGYDGNSSE